MYEHKHVLLNRLIAIYGNDLIIHGSYARHMVTGAPHRDIDIIVKDDYLNVRRMLEDLGVDNLKEGSEPTNIMLMRHAFEYEGQAYDIQSFHVCVGGMGNILDYIYRFPRMKHLVISFGGELPAHSAEWIEENLDKPNPHFSYRYFCKDEMDIWLEKFGEMPPVHSDNPRDLNGRKGIEETYLRVFQYVIPECHVDDPFCFTEVDRWESPYRLCSLRKYYD